MTNTPGGGKKYRKKKEIFVGFQTNLNHSMGMRVKSVSYEGAVKIVLRQFPNAFNFGR